MTDTLFALAHLENAPHAQAARQQRAKAVDATQACEDLLLGGALPGGLTQPTRLAVAQHVAAASGVDALAAHYGQRLQRVPAPAQNARWDAIRHFTQLLATAPAAADRAALQALPAAGLATPDVVLLAQLIGFVAYQARVLAGVSALAALGPAGQAAPASAGAAPHEPFVHPANLPAPGEPLRLNGYTSETLDWKSWLPVVDPASASDKRARPTSTWCWRTSRACWPSARRPSTPSCTRPAGCRAPSARWPPPWSRASTAACTAPRCTRSALSSWPSATT